MIYGERIRFRAPERSDIPLWTAWLNDPEVLQGLAFRPPVSSATFEKQFDDILESGEKAETYTFMIEVRQENDPANWKPVGTAGLLRIDWLSRSAELSIYIGEKAFWNQGFGTEATSLLLHFTFNTLNLNRIYLRVWETNANAIHIYEKVGFVHEGRMRQAVFKEGRYIDVLYMGILRSEYKG